MVDEATWERNARFATRPTAIHAPDAGDCVGAGVAVCVCVVFALTLARAEQVGAFTEANQTLAHPGRLWVGALFFYT